METRPFSDKYIGCRRSRHRVVSHCAPVRYLSMRPGPEKLVSADPGTLRQYFRLVSGDCDYQCHHRYLYHAVAPTDTVESARRSQTQIGTDWILHLRLLVSKLRSRQKEGGKIRKPLISFTDATKIHSVITCSLGRMVAIVQLNKRLEGSPTCTYRANKRTPCDTGSVACNPWVLIGHTNIGNYVTFVYWTASELAISIVSICLPNMVQLFRRAYEHGTPALFTSREYPTGSAGSTFVQGGKGGFQRIVVNDGTTFAIHNDPLDQRIDQSILYSVTVSAQRPGETETAALGQVHMRQDFVVREDERWATVWPEMFIFPV